MTYTPQHIANYFLQKAEQEGIPMSPLKLIKLVYIAYGWYIALTDKHLFNEPIEAWKHGPVIESLYHEFKHYGSGPITDKAENFDMDTFEMTIPTVLGTDEETTLILSKVWVSYKRFTAWTLRDKTHEKGGPWNKVFQDGSRGVELKDEHIRKHYIQKIRQYIDAAKTDSQTTKTA